MAGSKYDDILNDGLLIQISIKVPKHVTPSNLSSYLGFNAEEGDHALILGLVQLDPKSAYESLLHKFVNRHGTDENSALMLRLIFLEKDMVACAKIIEKELDKYGITYPSRADTVGEPLNLPSTSNVKPGSETPVAPTPSRADTVIDEPFDLPSTPHVKPGSETPVAPTPSEPNRQTRQSHGQNRQPPGRPVQSQQQPSSFSRGMIFKVVFVAIIAVIVYFFRR